MQVLKRLMRALADARLAFGERWRSDWLLEQATAHDGDAMLQLIRACPWFSSFVGDVSDSGPILPKMLPKMLDYAEWSQRPDGFADVCKDFDRLAAPSIRVLPDYCIKQVHHLTGNAVLFGRVIGLVEGLRHANTSTEKM